MQLRQLRYILAVAECGSINSASQRLYVSQSSVSIAIQEVERELNITIFNRSNRGIELTGDGVEFIGYAREVIGQTDRMLNHYQAKKETPLARLSVSAQHYPLAMQAFLDIVDIFNEGCEFTYRETYTSEVIDDVKSFRSDLGIIYLGSANRSYITKLLETSHMEFESLFRAKPHVIVSPMHPLAEESKLEVKQLAKYPRFVYDQGRESSVYYAEEPLSNLPCTSRIAVSDYNTLLQLLTRGRGYTIGSGALPNFAGNSTASVPLETDEVMNVGYITRVDRKMSVQSHQFLQLFARRIADYGEYEGILVPSKKVFELLDWQSDE